MFERSRVKYILLLLTLSIFHELTFDIQFLKVNETEETFFSVPKS